MYKVYGIVTYEDHEEVYHVGSTKTIEQIEEWFVNQNHYDTYCYEEVNND